MLQEDPIEAALRGSALFASLGRIARARLARQCQLVRLPGGEVLYTEGSAAEALYLIARGRMRSERLVDGQRQTLRELRAGETIGGLSLMAGKPHRATVRAVRDCVIICIPRAAVERLMYRHPHFGRDATRDWLRAVLYTPPSKAGDERRSARTLAIVPAHAGAPVEVVSDALLKALHARGSVVRVDGACIDGPDTLQECEHDLTSPDGVGVLDALESTHRFVIYMARQPDDEWSARCLRQADRVVVVAASGVTARASELSRRMAAIDGSSEPEIVIVGAGKSDPIAWRTLYSARMHHRVRVGDRAGFDRMVRLLTGSAIGLALGGGGARGFAHIGLLQAMETLHIQPDLVVGTSMGALIGALAASGLDATAIRTRVHDMFVARNLLNDFTVPRVSLIRARRARAHLEQLFGDRQLEDLPSYFACTTTNLTRARAELHDRGSIAHWLTASMSVPGVAPPVIYKGDVLVDGGVLTPVPSNVLADLGRGPVLASDVSADESFAVPASETPHDSAERLNIFRVLYRTATLSTIDDLRAREARSDLYLRMPVSGIGMFDWDALDDLISRGREHAEKRLRQWLEMRDAANGGDAPLLSPSSRP